MVSQLTRHKFTVDEYHKMAEAGIFTEDDRVELLDGEIVEMTPIGKAHAGRVNRLIRAFSVLLPDRAVVSVQNPIHLSDDSEPQPDFALLAPRRDFYTSALPEANDILLVVEVADSSLGTDRTVKARLYARADIREMWLANLVDQRIEVYRDPSPDGYRSVVSVGPGGTVSPLAFPDIVLMVDDILG